MNKCVFIGRLTADPELTKVNETQVVNFSLALEEYRKDKKTGEKKKRVDYIACELWDTGAQVIYDFCRKGDKIAVECKARLQKWSNDEDEKREKINFRVESFELLGTKDNPE